MAGPTRTHTLSPGPTKSSQHLRVKLFFLLAFHFKRPQNGKRALIWGTKPGLLIAWQMGDSQGPFATHFMEETSTGIKGGSRQERGGS